MSPRMYNIFGQRVPDYSNMVVIEGIYKTDVKDLKITKLQHVLRD